jgi:hypothetical protein
MCIQNQSSLKEIMLEKLEGFFWKLFFHAPIPLLFLALQVGNPG